MSPFDFELLTPDTGRGPARLRVVCHGVAGPWVMVTYPEVFATAKAEDQDGALLGLYDRKWQAGEITAGPELEGLAP